jgi:hypothetical protein
MCNITYVILCLHQGRATGSTLKTEENNEKDN